MGDFEGGPLGLLESLVKYHPNGYGYLTAFPQREPGQRMVGSLTGAVASQRVTEARDGRLRPVGNRSSSAMA